MKKNFTIKPLLILICLATPISLKASLLKKSKVDSKQTSGAIKKNKSQKRTFRRRKVSDGFFIDEGTQTESEYRSDLRGSNLNGANLEKVYLSETCIGHSSLVKTNFSGATLKNVSFNESDLSESNFSGATLTKINFKIANLEGVNFEEVQFFNDVDFLAANLKNANFKNAKGLTQSQKMYIEGKGAINVPK